MAECFPQVSRLPRRTSSLLAGRPLCWRIRMKHGFEIPEAWFVSFVPGEYKKSWPACR